MIHAMELLLLMLLDPNLAAAHLQSWCEAIGRAILVVMCWDLNEQNLGSWEFEKKGSNIFLNHNYNTICSSSSICPCFCNRAMLQHRNRRWLSSDAVANKLKPAASQNRTHKPTTAFFFFFFLFFFLYFTPACSVHSYPFFPLLFSFLVSQPSPCGRKARAAKNVLKNPFTVAFSEVDSRLEHMGGGLIGPRWYWGVEIWVWVLEMCKGFCII